MKFVKTILIGTAISTTLAFGAVAQDKPSPDTVVAIVDDQKITLANVVALSSRLPAQYSNMPADQLFEAVLDQLVQQVALAKEATISESTLTAILTNEERAFKATARLDKIADTAATEEAIKAAYEVEVKSTAPVEELLASHILVETEEEAKAIIEMLNGGADFGETAKEKSTGPSGPNGGDLGWFGRGAMVPEFDMTVGLMKIGSISAPVQTQFGWHVIKLFDKRDHAPFEDLRGKIEAELTDAAIGAEIEKAMTEVKVERPEVAFDKNIIRDSGFLQ